MLPYREGVCRPSITAFSKTLDSNLYPGLYLGRTKKLMIEKPGDRVSFDCPVSSSLFPEFTADRDRRSSTVYAVSAGDTCRIFDKALRLSDIVPGAYLVEELSSADKEIKTYTVVAEALPSTDVNLCYICVQDDGWVDMYTTVITVKGSRGNDEQETSIPSSVCKPSFSLAAWALGVRQPTVALDVTEPRQSVRFGCQNSSTLFPREVGEPAGQAFVYPVSARGMCQLSEGVSTLESYLSGASLEADVGQKVSHLFSMYRLTVPTLPDTEKNFCYVCTRHNDPANGCAVLVQVRAARKSEDTGNRLFGPVCPLQGSPLTTATGLKNAAMTLDIRRSNSSVQFLCPDHSQVLPSNAPSERALEASVFAVAEGNACRVEGHRPLLQDVVPGAKLTEKVVVAKGSVTRAYTFAVRMLPATEQKLCYVCARSSSVASGCGIVITVKGKGSAHQSEGVPVCQPRYSEETAARGVRAPLIKLVVGNAYGTARFQCPGNSRAFPAYMNEKNQGVSAVYQVSDEGICKLRDNPDKLDDILSGAALQANPSAGDGATTYSLMIATLPQKEIKLCYACVADNDVANSCGVMITVKPESPLPDVTGREQQEFPVCTPEYSVRVAETGLKKPSLVLKVNDTQRAVHFTCARGSLMYPELDDAFSRRSAITYSVSELSCNLWGELVDLEDAVPGATLVSNVVQDGHGATETYTFALQELPATPQKLCYLCIQDHDILNSCAVLIDIMGRPPLESATVPRATEAKSDSVIPTTTGETCSPTFSAHTAATGRRRPEMELFINNLQRTVQFACPDGSFLFPEFNDRAGPVSGKVYRIAGDSCDIREEAAYLQDVVPGAELRLHPTVEGGEVQRLYSFHAEQLPQQDQRLCYLCVRGGNPADSCAVMVTVEARLSAAPSSQPHARGDVVEPAPPVCTPVYSPTVAESGIVMPALELTIDEGNRMVHFVCPGNSSVLPDRAAVAHPQVALVYPVGLGGTCDLGSPASRLADLLPGAALRAHTAAHEGGVGRAYTFIVPTLPEQDKRLCYVCASNRQTAESCGIQITVKGTNKRTDALRHPVVCNLSYSSRSHGSGTRKAAIELVVEKPNSSVRFTCPERSRVFPDFATSTGKSCAPAYAVRGNECVFSGQGDSQECLVPPGAMLRAETIVQDGVLARTYTFTVTQLPAQDMRFCYLCARDEDMYQSCGVIISVKGTSQPRGPEKGLSSTETASPICFPQVRGNPAQRGSLEPSVYLSINHPRDDASFVCPAGSAVSSSNGVEPQVYVVGSSGSCLPTNTHLSLSAALPGASLSANDVTEDKMVLRKYTLNVPRLPEEDAKLCYVCVNEMEPQNSCAVAITVKGKKHFLDGLVPPCAPSHPGCASDSHVTKPRITLTVDKEDSKVTFQCPASTSLYPDTTVVPANATIYPTNDRGSCVYHGGGEAPVLDALVPGATLQATAGANRGAASRSYTLDVRKLPEEEVRMCYLCMHGGDPSNSYGIVVTVKSSPTSPTSPPGELEPPVCAPACDATVGKTGTVKPRVTLTIDKPGGSASFECPAGSTILPDHAETSEQNCALVYGVQGDSCDVRGPTAILASLIPGAKLHSISGGEGELKGKVFTLTVPELPPKHQRVCYLCTNDRDLMQSCGVLIDVKPQSGDTTVTASEVCELGYAPTAVTTGLRVASVILDVREPNSGVEFVCPDDSMVIPISATYPRGAARVYPVHGKDTCATSDTMERLTDRVPGARLTSIPGITDGEKMMKYTFSVSSLPEKNQAICYVCVAGGDLSRSCGVVINVHGTGLPAPPSSTELKIFDCPVSYSEGVKKAGTLQPAVRLMVTAPNTPVGFKCTANAKVYPPSVTPETGVHTLVYSVGERDVCNVGEPLLSLNAEVPGAKLTTKKEMIDGSTVTTGVINLPMLPSRQRKFCFACVDRDNLLNSCGILMTVPSARDRPVLGYVCNDVKTLNMTVNAPGAVTVRCGFDFPDISPAVDTSPADQKVYYGELCGDAGALRSVIPGATLVRESAYNNLEEDVAAAVTLNVPPSATAQTICLKCLQPKPFEYKACTVRVATSPLADETKAKSNHTTHSHDGDDTEAHSGRRPSAKRNPEGDTKFCIHNNHTDRERVDPYKPEGITEGRQTEDGIREVFGRENRFVAHYSNHYATGFAERDSGADAERYTHGSGLVKAGYAENNNTRPERSGATNAFNHLNRGALTAYGGGIGLAW
ncbi:SAG-related sequence SRS44 [Besnoitia besnoiti]|uniref:SAG-related sequence SRS44 n=1 Tax=Besnoitia besnoiti TaxID=94643 RepID=A0A2A9MFB5_BESBE|nr:SAG-related sequence SRS44 [Besnoitia besnoiti]PFH36609.1 SAG-related sequence SRS44 [Besnoitia besnoiti]